MLPVEVTDPNSKSSPDHEVEEGMFEGSQVPGQEYGKSAADWEGKAWSPSPALLEELGIDPDDPHAGLAPLPPGSAKAFLDLFDSLTPEGLYRRDLAEWKAASRLRGFRTFDAFLSALKADKDGTILLGNVVHSIVKGGAPVGGRLNPRRSVLNRLDYNDLVWDLEDYLDRYGEARMSEILEMAQKTVRKGAGKPSQIRGRAASQDRTATKTAAKVGDEIVFAPDLGGAGDNRYVIEKIRPSSIGSGDTYWVREYHARHGRGSKLLAYTPRKWAEFKREADEHNRWIGRRAYEMPGSTFRGESQGDLAASPARTATTLEIGGLSPSRETVLNILDEMRRERIILEWLDTNRLWSQNKAIVSAAKKFLKKRGIPFRVSRDASSRVAFQSLPSKIALRHLEARYSVENQKDLKEIKEKLQKTYTNVPDKAVRQAIYVWNSVFDRYGDEGRAWASLYGVMNRRGLNKRKKPGKKKASSLSYRIDYPYAYKKRTKSVWGDGVKEKMGSVEDFFSVGDKLFSYRPSGFGENSRVVFGKRGAYMVGFGKALQAETPVQIVSLDSDSMVVRVLGAPKVKAPKPLKPRAPRKPVGPLGKADPLSKRQWAAILNAMRRGYDNSYAMMVDDAFKPFQRASKKYGLGDYYDGQVFQYLFGKVRRFNGNLSDQEVEMLNEMKAAE